MLSFHVQLKTRVDPERSPAPPGFFETLLQALRTKRLARRLEGLTGGFPHAIAPVRVRLGARRAATRRFPLKRYEVDLFDDRLVTAANLFFQRIQRGAALALLFSVSLFTFSSFTVKRSEAAVPAGAGAERLQAPPCADTTEPLFRLPGDCPAVLLATDCFQAPGDCSLSGPGDVRTRELKRALDRHGDPALLGAYHDNTPGIDHVNVVSHNNAEWQNHTNMVTPHSNTPWSNHINNAYPHTNLVPGDFIY